MDSNETTQKLIEAFDSFEFNLGDIVRHKIAREFTEPGRHYGMKEKETRLLITERLMQQCPGGFQRHYRCTPAQADGNFAQTCQLLEIELVASEPFESDEPLKD
jgi:hypothetical protein